MAHTINPGETASSLLSAYLDASEMHTLAESCEPVHSLRRIRAGQSYYLTIEDGELTAFEYEIDNETRLVATRNEDGFCVTSKRLYADIETRSVEGVITSNLFNAVTEQGETPELAVRLADIFAWEIDFIRDIREGDSFRVLVERRSIKGEHVGYGRILAAEFSNQNQHYEGYLFQTADGDSAYYTSDGKSLRKAFLKAPLHFTRVSSGFNLRRLHPILKVRRPHPAIDYAAPTGTPVMAIGDGTVITRAYGRGAGNYVKLRHVNGYESAYLHLSKFAKGVSKGSRVQQGQVIGYVGSTGMSTGPHLDFRMKKDGEFINPTNIKNVRAEPLTESQMAQFRLAVAAHKSRMYTPLADASMVQR